MLHRQELVGDLAQDHAEIPFFLEDAHAEAGHVAEGEAEIGATALADMLHMIVRSDAAHQFLTVLGLKRGSLNAMEDAVNTNSRWSANANMEVGSAFRDDQLQQIGH